MGSVTFEDMTALVEGDNPGSTLLVDVRSTEEFSHGRIPWSVCIPLPSLPEAFALEPLQFQQKFGVDKPQSADEIVVTCR